MTIKIKVARPVQIRRLNAFGLDADDIVKVTGYAPTVVKAALAVQRAAHK